ncbi:MAG: GIY-YIG nuclease family protein [Chloroflexota bacterium]|nr:GIY-YIG nuclease family protein [Chloroflexota bacterium]
MWYLYVLHCRDNSLYTGITTDVARRVAEHQAGVGARYTRAHLPVELLAAWQYPNRSVATRVEHRFKALTHQAKSAWVESRQPFMDGDFVSAMFDK